MHTTLNYSPNFDNKKRKPKQIKFIIIHYTGMRSQKDAIKKLTSINSKVSSHYFIKNNGEILNLIPDLYIAWHAGVSSWKKFKSINKYSIGIEINNPGHENLYKDFTKEQIMSVLKLCRFLIKKYKVDPKFILGHSDISPDRKKDPGEKFPWEYLNKRKIGYWHGLNKKKLINQRNQKVTVKEKKIFINNLIKIGYSKKMNKKTEDYFKILASAFQRRFRQELIDGKIDKECLIISENLVKKYK